MSIVRVAGKLRRTGGGIANRRTATPAAPAYSYSMNATGLGETSGDATLSLTFSGVHATIGGFYVRVGGRAATLTTAATAQTIDLRDFYPEPTEIPDPLDFSIAPIVSGVRADPAEDSIGLPLPVISVAPAISAGLTSGEARIGTQLTGSVTWADADTVTNQWVRHLEGVETVVATGTTYTPVATDDVHFLLFRSRAAKTGGTEVVQDSASAIVKYTAPVLAGSISNISTTEAQGEVVTFEASTAITGDGLRWEISGLSGASIDPLDGTVIIPRALTSATVVSVTASNSGGSQQTSFTFTCNPAEPQDEWPANPPAILSVREITDPTEIAAAGYPNEAGHLEFTITLGGFDPAPTGYQLDLVPWGAAGAGGDGLPETNPYITTDNAISRGLTSVTPIMRWRRIATGEVITALTYSTITIAGLSEPSTDTEFVDGYTAADGATTLTLTGALAGDVCWLVRGHNGTSIPALLAGWTSVATKASEGASVNCSMRVMRRAVASDDEVLAIEDANLGWGAVVFRGVNAESEVVVTPVAGVNPTLTLPANDFGQEVQGVAVVVARSSSPDALTFGTGWTREASVLTGTTGTLGVARKDALATSVAAQNITVEGRCVGCVIGLLPTGTVVEPPATGLPLQPQAQVDAAIARPLVSYIDIATKGSGIGPNGGGNGDAGEWAPPYAVLGLASFSGNTSADARLTAALQNTASGGKEPAGGGGYPTQHEIQCVLAIALAKQTPRIWNALTSTQRNRLDIAMKGCLIGAAYTSGQNNFQIAANTNDPIKSIRAEPARWKTSAPNFRIAPIGVMLAAHVYFGSAQAVLDYLNSYSHSGLRAAAQAEGFTILANTLNPSGANGSLGTRPTATQVQNGVANWAFAKNNAAAIPLSNTRGLLEEAVNQSFNRTINSGLNGGAGILVNGVARGRIINGAGSLPSSGQSGMATELDYSDGGGSATTSKARSSMSYSMWGIRCAMLSFVIAGAGGLIVPTDAWVQTLKTKMHRGMTDFKYKSDNGYRSFAHGGSGAGNEDWTTANESSNWAWNYNFGLWFDVLKPWLDG